MVEITNRDSWRLLRQPPIVPADVRLRQRKLSVEVGIVAAAIGLFALTPLLLTLAPHPSAGLFALAFFGPSLVVSLALRWRLGKVS